MQPYKTGLLVVVSCICDVRVSMRGTMVWTTGQSRKGQLRTGGNPAGTNSPHPLAFSLPGCRLVRGFPSSALAEWFEFVLTHTAVRG